MENSRVAGKFIRQIGSKSLLLINIDLFKSGQGIEKALESVIHELAHYAEGSENHGYNFTHQVNGSFGRYYKEVVGEMLKLMLDN